MQGAQGGCTWLAPALALYLRTGGRHISWNNGVHCMSFYVLLKPISLLPSAHPTVPQGTMPGPFLFSIFINDLPGWVCSMVRFFADDCIVYREIDSIDDQLALQRDLDSLEAWVLKWGMRFIPSKSTILSIFCSPPLHKFYSLCCTILHVKEINYLGVNINDELHWSQHVQNITSYASSTLGLLRRNAFSCPRKLGGQAYILLIRSWLEFCAGIWDPHLDKNIQLLESVQWREAPFGIQDYSWYSSVISYLKDLNWAPLKDRWCDIRLTLS